MDNGIVISSGKVADLKGYPGNDSNPKSNDMKQPGYSDLDIAVSGDTKDAASIEINFTSNSGMIYFNIVFAAEEYKKYVDSEYNDVAGIFLDGKDYSLLDYLKSIDNKGVSKTYSGLLSLNTLFTNKDLYIDNRNKSNDFAANVYSHILRFGIPISDINEHSLKFAAADWHDSALDSWFLINGLSGEEEFIEPQDPEFQYNSEAIHIDTQDKAQHALVRIDDAIVTKDKIREHLGAMHNRLENTITNITTQAENLQASESRISDVDVATEMTNFVRDQILSQSAVAMLSLANSMPQMAMQIIGG